MNRKQGITILCAGIVLNLIKMAPPVWHDGEEGEPFLGVFNNSSLMLLLAGTAILFVI